MEESNLKTTIQVENLSVSFNQHIILNNITLNFQQNHINVLVGKSGSGKTTFLRALNCLNQEYPKCTTYGKINIDIGMGLQPILQQHGKTTLNLQQLRQKVGMLFQTPQLLPVSIYKNIAMPFELIANKNSKQAKDKVEEMLKLVCLWDEVHHRLNHPAERLSGGQQQRLCLARTLALEPTILLLDEPTSSLDMNATQQIESLLLNLKDRYTIVMVSHSLEQAMRLADTLTIFEHGKVIKSYIDMSTLEIGEITQWFHK